MSRSAGSAIDGQQPFPLRGGGIDGTALLHRRGKTSAEMRVHDELRHGRSERNRVARRDEQAVVTMADHVGNSADGGRDNGNTEAEGFEDGVWRAFGEAGLHHAVEETHPLAGITLEACEANSLAEAGLGGQSLERELLASIANHDEVEGISTAEKFLRFGKCVEHVAMTLFGTEASNGAEDECVCGNVERCAGDGLCIVREWA